MTARALLGGCYVVMAVLLLSAVVTDQHTGLGSAHSEPVHSATAYEVGGTGSAVAGATSAVGHDHDGPRRASPVVSTSPLLEELHGLHHPQDGGEDHPPGDGPHQHGGEPEMTSPSLSSLADDRSQQVAEPPRAFVDAAHAAAGRGRPD